MRQLVSTHTSASARRTMWPTTILHCSLICRGTHQNPCPRLLTPSRPFTPSLLWWRRPWRCIRGRWSLWRVSYLCGTQYGSPGCSPAAPHSVSFVSTSKTNRMPSHYNIRSFQWLTMTHPRGKKQNISFTIDSVWGWICRGFNGRNWERGITTESGGDFVYDLLNGAFCPLHAPNSISK